MYKLLVFYRYKAASNPGTLTCAKKNSVKVKKSIDKEFFNVYLII